MIKRKFPKSTRRPQNHCCKNCEHITVDIRLPDLEVDATTAIVETAKACTITHECDFYCMLMPEWRIIPHEEHHHCAQFKLRDNWQRGYQDIERTWEEVDRVYTTRYDCKCVPERVRLVA